MKSFKVAEFNAPLKEVDRADAAAAGTPGADQGEGRRRLPQRPAYLGRRLRSRPRPQAAVAEGSRRVAAAHHGPRDGRRGRRLRARRQGRPTRAASRSATSRWSIPGSAAANARPASPATRTCACKPHSLGVYCDGGYADHMTVPHPKYLLNLKGLDPVTAAPYACSGVTTYSALKKVESGFRHADRDLRRRRPRPDGAVAAEGDGRQGRHRGRYRRAQARGRRKGRRARDRRRRGAGRAGAARAEGRRSDPRGDRSRRQRQDHAARLRLPRPRAASSSSSACSAAARPGRCR